jgi:hypothetical protein
MSAELPPVVSRYFELDASRDIDSMVALFTDDGVVVDEGETWAGVAAIHDWQAGPASRYIYTTEVLGSESVASDRFVVVGRLTGNFPGETADLKVGLQDRGRPHSAPGDRPLRSPEASA